MTQTRQHIIDLLGSIGRAPNRKLGQHFMIDPALIERLVAEAGAGKDGGDSSPGEVKLGAGPLILEVGPGTGALTVVLLEAGCEVLAVEIDPVLADLVEAEFGERFPGRLHVIRGDVLEGKHRLNARMLSELARLCGGRTCRLVANLPYNIASPLLAELVNLTWRAAKCTASNGEPGSSFDTRDSTLGIRFDRLVFTVQREVADRLAGGPGGKDYGPLSVLCQGLGVVHTLVHKISPNAFYPKPNVFSAMLRVDLPADRVTAVADLAALHAWVDVGFGHRRKMLSAAIRLAPAEWQVRLTAAALSAGLDLSRRGETLTVAEYLALAGQT